MNAKQLLLGLSILVPAGAYASVNQLYWPETVKIPDTLCDMRLKGWSGYFMIHTQPCYKLEYRYRPGLLFVWIDTLQGTFFGFGVPTVYNSTYEILKAYQDLIKNLISQYKGMLGIGSYRDVLKDQNKKIPY